MSRLVAMLLQAGALTPERAKEARGHQVVFGDRIGTNLLALGFINELTLVQALGALHQMAFAAGREADSKPALTRALPRQTAARLSCIPARADDDVVHVFVMDPLPPEALAELQAHFKRRVVGVLIAEARMWALLHKFYLVKRGMRAIRLDDDDKRTAIKPRSAERHASSVATAVSLLDSAPAAPSSGAHGQNGVPQRAPVNGSVVPAPAARPVDTNWLQSVLPAPATPTTLPPTTLPPATLPPHSSVAPAPLPTLPLPSPTSLPPASLPMPSPHAPHASLAPATLPTLPQVKEAPATWLPVAARPEEQKRFDDLVADELPLTELVPELEPVAAPAARVSPPSSLSARPVFAEADIPFDELVEDALVEEAIVLGEIVDDVAPEDTSPLDFDSARKELSGVEDRKTISRIVLRYAMSRVKRALLLTVQGAKGNEEAFGWDALGEGLRPGLIHDVRLKLSGEPSALQLARESRAHVLGPLGKSTVNDELVSLLGGKPPKTAFVMPILARGRVVNLLYLDNGPGRFMEPDIGELLILCQHINKSYEKLLMKAS